MRTNQQHHGIAVGLCALLCAGTASAQNATDKAAADTLFNEGKRLIARDDTAGACAKFEASLSKMVQLGTQMALASCYEKAGKLTSAWGEFRTAAVAAAKLHDKRQRFAEERAAALEPRLPKLAVVVIANRADGLEVRRDGVELSAAELGTPVPVDPGEHTVEASAPGRRPWAIKVAVPATPGVIDVPIPALDLDATPALQPKADVAVTVPTPAEAATSSHQRRWLAYGVGGGGVALVGVSLIFGALAKASWSDAQTHCNAGQCDATGVDLAGSARTKGNVATATFLIGFAGAAVGGVLLFTGSAEHERNATALRVLPAVDASQVGLSFQGGF